MPLVTSLELLKKARAEKFAVGAFNANNMEMVQGIVEAAAEEKSPVILQISQGTIKYAGMEYAVNLVRIAAEKVPIPVVLHFDHGTSFEQVIRCLHAGFTSLMYDGSKEPYEKNLEITRRLAEIAHAAGIPLEAELGRVALSNERLSEEEIKKLYTDPQQAKEFVEETGCDSLAVAVGSVHQMKQQSAKLDIERIEKISSLVNIPLVLHGSSGVEIESIKQGISAGICKINVATALSVAFIKGVKEGFHNMPEAVDFRPIFSLGKDRVKEVVKSYINIFNSAGKG